MREIFRGLFNSSENIVKVVPDVYQDGIHGLTFSNPKNEQWCFYKSHSAKELTKHKGNAVNNDLIVYVIRNPLDVFCSQLNYLLKDFSPFRGGIQVSCSSIEEATQNGLICDYFSAFLIYGTLMPFFVDARSWMENTSYWVERARKSEKIIVVKYEDLLEQPEVAMNPVLNRLGLSLNDLQNAIDLANTRTNDGGKFFWKKTAGTHKEFLTNKQINRFMNLHKNIIDKCGYTNQFKQYEVSCNE